jgi:hypothetical protein
MALRKWVWTSLVEELEAVLVAGTRLSELEGEEAVELALTAS